MKFNTREEYVEAVKQWKIAYKQLSQQIRDGKLARKRYQQAWAKAEIDCREPGMYPNYSKTFHKTKEYLAMDTIYQELYTKYSDKSTYWCYPYYFPWKKKAREMIEERKAARIEAQRQYLEARKKDLTFASVQV